MELKERFGKGLLLARNSRNLTQEDFALISSRTYLSRLERGLQSPTMEKIEQLAKLLEVHPITLFALGYAPNGQNGIDALCNQVRDELSDLKVKRK